MYRLTCRYCTIPQATILPLLVFCMVKITDRISKLSFLHPIFQSLKKKSPKSFLYFYLPGLLAAIILSYITINQNIVSPLGTQLKNSLHAQAPLLFHFSVELGGYPKYIQDKRKLPISKHGANFIAIFK